MNAINGPSTRYKLEKKIAEGDGFTIHQATELTIGAPCFYHDIRCDSGLGETARQSAIATIRRYGLLRAPRTPRLVNGWIADDHFVAIEYKEQGTPISQANNPFTEHGRNKGEVFLESLQLMVAMNRCNIIHGQVEPSTFITGPQGKIFLNDTGLDRALVRCARTNAASQFTLANNLSGLDVAQWAFAMLSLYTGSSLLEGSLAERWDAFEFEQAVKKLQRVELAPEVYAFFERCLRGYTGEAPLFDSAIDALKAWETGKLGGMIK
jgi:hypothetical protein